MRRPLIAGNWKMNLGLRSGRELIGGICAQSSDGGDIEVVICPPFIYLFPMAKAVAGTSIGLGAQDVYPKESGAFTGEVSAAMVKETGCAYCIVGHSERRHTIGPAREGGGVHGENDALVNQKVRVLLSAGLTPILCVGETLAQRETNQTESVLLRQIDGGLADVGDGDAWRVVLAYEPVWAIGTGRTATPQQAQDVHAFIRRRLSDRYGADVARQVRILYGGSVKASNAEALTAQPDIDGALVGGASLKADEFVGIIRACAKAKGAPAAC
ncbi:MAG: triose-phosphate isomerase [Phycisphaerae bacterium]